MFTTPLGVTTPRLQIIDLEYILVLISWSKHTRKDVQVIIEKILSSSNIQ